MGSSIGKRLLVAPLAFSVVVIGCGDGGGSHGASRDGGDAASADVVGETGVQLKVRSDHCPAVFPTAAPSEAAVGMSISVSAMVDDPDADGLAFLWSARAGTFVTAWAPSTEYTCQEAGEQILTVTVSDGQCNGEAKIPVTCR